MQTVVIIGASGFIGKHLAMELALTNEFDIRVLSRNRQRDLTEKSFPSSVEIVEGSLQDQDSIDKLLKPGCTVINLAYLWNGSEAENLLVTDNLLTACKNAAIARLIHCSTAAVVGRVRENTITEETICNPVSNYGITKLKIEQAVLMAASQKLFDTVIVRPTAVFGNEGAQLKKLSRDLLKGNPWLNYAKSCLFGERRMNLVHISNVVAAIVFLIKYPQPIGGEVFIVSDDDDPKNNFSYIEQYLMNALRIKDYPLPRFSLPLCVLSFLLAIRGRNNINPSCCYAPDKLLRLGFMRTVSLEEGLADYVKWCCAEGDKA